MRSSDRSGCRTNQLRRIKDLQLVKMISEQLAGSNTIVRPCFMGMGSAHHRFPYVRRAIPRLPVKSLTRRDATRRPLRSLASMVQCVLANRIAASSDQACWQPGVGTPGRALCPGPEDQLPAPRSIRGRNHANNPASGRIAQMRKTVSTPWLSANTPRIAAAMPPSPKFRP